MKNCENIQDAYNEWQNAMANFETAEGKEMVDYYAYKIKASEIRYDYLLRKAKRIWHNKLSYAIQFGRIF